MAAPTVLTTAETAVTTAGTNHAITLPSGIVANDLILICLDKGSTAATVNAHADYTELLDENAGNGLYIAYRFAAGGEGNPTLVTSANTRSATIALRIGGAVNPATQAPVIGTTSTGTSATADPPASASPSAPGDYLVIALYGSAGEEADDDSWANFPPTSYLPSPPLQKACGTVGTNLGGLIALSYRQMPLSASENPGTFNQDVSLAWRAQTVLVYPSFPGTPEAIMPSMVSD